MEGASTSLFPSSTLDEKQSTPYTVLARKYRSAQFSDIVGQGSVVRTLMNAIKGKRVHQAYLFTGSRGIGKTSIARILAKALRCENTKWGPAPSPLAATTSSEWLFSCDTCSSCREIATSSSVDVVEIDGASNNGVDAVREIRDSTRYLPSSGDRKIYIIDEVHMLTTAAFNALLKTLEEPPAHVVFIFATTEPHKIPATILSRCQRFDFRRLTSSQIEVWLQEISKRESIEVEPAVFSLIARGADGGMRDALSLFDQVIAYAGTTVTAAQARDALGLMGSEILFKTARGILERKPLDALSGANTAFENGHDLKLFLRGLLEIFHGVLLAKSGAFAESGMLPGFSVPFSPEETTLLKEMSQLRELEEVEMLFQVFHHGLDTLAHSGVPKVTLDVLLIKAASAEILVEIGGTAKGAGPVSAAPLAPPLVSAAPIPKAAPALAKPILSAPMTEAIPVVAPEANAPTLPAALNENTWEPFIEFVRTKRPLLASVLEHGRPIPSTLAGVLSVQFAKKDAYYRDQLQSRVYQEELRNLGKDFFKAPVVFKLELLNSDAEAFESVALKRERNLQEKQTQIRSSALHHPVIVEARSLFGGELGPIEIADAEGKFPNERNSSEKPQ